MTETELWDRYSAARRVYANERTSATESALIDAFSAFAIVFIGDPVAAHEETERLRQNLA